MPSIGPHRRAKQGIYRLFGVIGLARDADHVAIDGPPQVAGSCAQRCSPPGWC
jgi:hypothetical protein